MIASVWKPWYLFRPSQIFRRGSRAIFRPGSGAVEVRLPWNIDIEIDPSETIGRSIWTTGIYELAVSETLWRLTRPGDLTVDAGANIGYMAGLLSLRAGKSGRVIAYEPHPRVIQRLRKNVARIGQHENVAPIDVRQVGLSDVTGTANLIDPPTSGTNHGMAFIGMGTDGFTIRTERLDDIIAGEETIGVLKLDVEGHEPAVLAGARSLLARHGIRHLVFEDHTGPDSEVMRVLVSAGYRVYRLGWQMRGPVLGNLTDQADLAQPYEAPNYLATIDAAELEREMSHPGWELFR